MINCPVCNTELCIKGTTRRYYKCETCGYYEKHKEKPDGH